MLASSRALNWSVVVLLMLVQIVYTILNAIVEVVQTVITLLYMIVQISIPVVLLQLVRFFLQLWYLVV